MLTCGAQPTAVIIWYNGTTPYNQQPVEYVTLKVIHKNSWVIAIDLVNGIEVIN